MLVKYFSALWDELIKKSKIPNAWMRKMKRWAKDDRIQDSAETLKNSLQ